MPLTIIIVFSFIFGASVGSFLNVVILRLPEEDASIVFPASRCPKCLQALKWYDNSAAKFQIFLIVSKRFSINGLLSSPEIGDIKGSPKTGGYTLYQIGLNGENWILLLFSRYELIVTAKNHCTR